MATKCYACKRSLSNPESVQLGIGPICRARRKRERDAQEKLDREASKCHHGFNCGNPHHVQTLVRRLHGSLEFWPKWLMAESDEAGVPINVHECNRLNEMIADCTWIIIDVLGLRRPPVQVPQIEQKNLEEMLKITGQFMNPANELQPGQFRIPPDIRCQYRHTVLRERGICPHGLDCREPNRAVAAVYSILSILRNEVEPLFRDTSYGGLVGASDAAYVACMNMLEVLGLEDEASYIYYRDLPKMRKQAQKNARRWERRLRKRGAA